MILEEVIHRLEMLREIIELLSNEYASVVCNMRFYDTVMFLHEVEVELIAKLKALQ